MYILDDKFIFLSTPRTGSRSISLMLKKIGARKLTAHHANPYEIYLAKRKWSDIPFYTMTREPMDHLISHYRMYIGPFNVGIEDDLLNVERNLRDIEFTDFKKQLSYRVFDHSVRFTEFLSTFNNRGRNWSKYKLNIYANYCDRFFKFEDGIEHFFDQLDLEMPEMCYSGVTNVELDIPERLIPFAKEKIADDIDFYRGL